MPPTTTDARRWSVAGNTRRCALALLAILTFGVSACTGLTPVNALTNEAQLLNDLIDRLRTRMSDPGAAGYTATYQLAGGLVGQISQLADSAAFRFPDGNLILTVDRTTACIGSVSGAVECVLTEPQPAAPAATFATATKHGLVTGPVLVDLLQTATNRSAWLSEQHDSTISGFPATCVSINPTDGTPAYIGCVTSGGVIGSFSGKIDSVTIDQNLTEYTDSAAPDAFKMPLGAAIVDERPPT